MYFCSFLFHQQIRDIEFKKERKETHCFIYIFSLFIFSIGSQQFNTWWISLCCLMYTSFAGADFKVADLHFGCATFCALSSFGAVTTFSSHTTFSPHKVSVKGSDIDMCSVIYFLFDHSTNYFTIY